IACVFEAYCPDIACRGSRHAMKLVIVQEWTLDDAPACAVPMLNECLTVISVSYCPDVVGRDSRYCTKHVCIRPYIWTLHHTPACAIPVFNQCSSYTTLPVSYCPDIVG